MDPADLQSLQSNILFRDTTWTQVTGPLAACAVRPLAKGEALLQPDVPNQHLYLVLSGELDVELASLRSTRHTTIAAGGCAGEISLVDGNPPSARVVASQPTRVLVIPHGVVWTLVDGSHAVARNLLAILAGRMRNENRALVRSIDESALYEHQATVDALTGLHNRRWMTTVFPRALQRCIKEGQPCSMLMADIDHFKAVNDVNGHGGGDAALRKVAELLSVNLRTHDLVVRYGGEEFCVLLPGSDLGPARAAAERIRQMLSATPVVNGDTEFSVTISMGVAAWAPGMDADAMAASADGALYEAKRAGRNCVMVASAGA